MCEKESYPGVSQLPFWMQLLCIIGHRYPFLSGSRRIGESKIVRALMRSVPGTVWADVKGGGALVPVEDDVGRSMFIFGDTDPRLSWILSRCVNVDDVVLDIGANLGLMSLSLAENVGQNGSVHAFEPNPKVLPYLKSTLERNSQLPITLHQFALGNKSGKIFINAPSGNLGSSRVFLSNAADEEKLFEIEMVTLDQYIAGSKPDKIDFIKIDVEGLEADVLLGARGLIEEFSPRAILFEEHGGNTEEGMPESIRVLSECGYQVFGIKNHLLTKMKFAKIHEDSFNSSSEYLAIDPSRKQEMPGLFLD